MLKDKNKVIKKAANAENLKDLDCNDIELENINLKEKLSKIKNEDKEIFETMEDFVIDYETLEKHKKMLKISNDANVEINEIYKKSMIDILDLELK